MLPHIYSLILSLSFATEPSKQPGPTRTNWISLPSPFCIAQLRVECCSVTFAIVGAHFVISNCGKLQS